MQTVFEAICKAYDLGELRGYEALNSGTQSKAWKLTADGYFLVRTLRDQAQGERELALNKQLIGRDFCRMPVIFNTVDRQAALLVDGVWYQVQQFLSGSMPDPAVPGVAAAMARTLRELSRCMPEGIIHGDLGPWNMVCHEDGEIYVIDFGSIREGDPYFDFAAAFGGAINHTAEPDRIRICREFLAELEADRGRLLAQLRLWAEEGIARWSGVSGNMTARFHHALRWAEEHIYEL